MLIEGCYNLIEKCLYSTSKCVTVGVWFGSKKVLPEVAKIFSQINISVVFYTCIQNQVIHKHVNVDYNPLKGMLILISSLKLSTVPYAAGPES